MVAQASPIIIQGQYRVLAIADLPRRASPNRRRAAARIVIWNVAFMAAVVALPILL